MELREHNLENFAVREYKNCKKGGHKCRLKPLSSVDYFRREKDVGGNNTSKLY